MLAKLKENGNSTMLKQLEAKPVTLEGGTPPGYDMIRDEAMHSLGIGTTHDMNSVITGILLPAWLNHDYTLSEKLNMWRGKAQSGISIVWATMLKTDLSQQTPRLAIPVYFFHGIYDYTCSYAQAKAYFEKLQAPVKGFYTFQRSAHSPMFEEPDRMEQILVQDVLNGTNRLADRE